MKMMCVPKNVNRALWTLAFLLVLCCSASDVAAQELTKEWSAIWRADEKPGHRTDRDISLRWDERQVGRKRSHGLLSTIALQVDHHDAADTIWQDVSVTLEVTAKCNPDHGDYRRSSDYDSVFVVHLHVGARPDGKGRAGLDSLLDVQDVDRVLFAEAHEVHCTVREIEVTDQSGPHVVEELPKNMFLELATRWQLRSLLMVTTSQLDFTDIHALNCSDGESGTRQAELYVEWEELATGGVEEYQLEWAYVDDYAETAGEYITDLGELHFNFDFDATRVSVHKGDHSYRIPLNYDRGYLVFRVRAVGVQDDTEPYPGGPVFGIWSGAASGSVNVIDNFHITTPHEPLKNWQVTSSYAEDGRHKEVMTYADGSLRTRQMVTRSSSLDVPIVGETFYDQAGRAVVEALPAPMIKDQECEDTDVGHVWAPVTYYPDFNVNAAGEPYSSDDLQASDGCGMKAAPMSDVNGAALYYSPEQLALSGKIIDDYPFLPKADGYPFAQTEYTRDNTGRVSRKGGVGAQLQLDAHPTTIQYSTPGQDEIDRLFGAEAGYASHYQKVTTIDPNKQASVAYLDRAGRTVATALVGEAGEGTEELQSRTDLVAQLHVTPLLGGETPSDENYDPDLPGWRFTSSFTVSEAAQYTIEYSLAPPSTGYVPECPEGLCYNCYYKLRLSVLDACGEPVDEGFPITETHGTLDELEVTQATAGSLDPGTYTIERVLTLDNDQTNIYLSDYMGRVDDCDEYTLEEITTQNIEASVSACELNCDICRDSLAGGLDAYLRSGRGTQQDYEALKAECDKLCHSPSWCEIAYGNMLLDLSPRGQYARFEGNGSNVNVTEFNSVLKPRAMDCMLAAKFTWTTLPEGEDEVDPNITPWRQPLIMVDGMWHEWYLEDDGTRARVSVFPTDTGFEPEVLNTGDVHELEGHPGEFYTFPENLSRLADFITAFHTAWARSLLRFHPEYVYYVDCRRYAEGPTVGDAFTSDGFDDRLRHCGSFAEAVADADAADNDWFDVPVDEDEPTVFNGGDPANPFADPYVVHASAFDTDAEDFAALITNYRTVGATSYSMMEVAAIINRCGGAMGSAISDECKRFGHGDPVVEAARLNNEFEIFKGIYLSEKYRAQKKHADRLAYTPGDCNAMTGINYCIGADHDDWYEWFSIMPGGYLGSGSQGCQPCAQWLFPYYADKVKRFAEPLLASHTSSPSYISYQNYMATGQCPMASAWQTMFDQLAIADRLITSNDLDDVATSGFPLATFAPYTSVILAQTDYAAPTGGIPEDLVWEGTPDLSGGIDISVGPYHAGGNCPVHLDAPVIGTAPGFDWERIIGIPRVNATASSDDFYLTVIYLDPDGHAHTTTVHGLMCDDYLLAPCNFPPICTPTALGYGIQGMMDLFASQEELFPDPVPLVLYDHTVGVHHLDFYLFTAITQLMGYPASDLTWSYDADTQTFMLQHDASGPGLVIEVLSTLDDVPLSTFVSTARAVTELSGDHENFFTAHLRNASNEDLTQIRCAVWWQPASGPREPLKPGICALPPSISCENTDDDLFGELFAWIRERMLSTPPEENIDLLASPLLTDRLRGVFVPLLCDGEIPLDGPITCSTTSTAEVAEWTTGPQPETLTTYTFDDGECVVIKMSLTDPVFDDIRDPHPLAPTDEGGAYHGLVADVYHGEERVGLLTVEVSCVGFKLCKTCGPPLCTEEQNATNWTDSLLAVLGDRYLAQYQNGQQADDLFGSPLMTPALAQELGPLICPDCPANEWHAMREATLFFSFDFGCLSLTGNLFFVSGSSNFWPDLPLLPTAYFNGWEPIDAADANGHHHRFKGFLWHDGERLRSFVVADLGCVRLPACPTSCEQLTALLEAVEWVAEQQRIIGVVNPPVEPSPEIFDAPSMDQSLADLLQDAFCPSCTDGDFHDYTSSPVLQFPIGGDAPILTYGDGDCFSIFMSKEVTEPTALSFSPWESVDTADGTGLHHEFRANVGYDNTFNRSTAVVLRTSCLGFARCSEVRDASARCSAEENALVEELIGHIADGILANRAAFASSSVNLNVLADASPELKSAVGPTMCGCPGPGFSSSSSSAGTVGVSFELTFLGGQPTVQFPDVTFDGIGRITYRSGTIYVELLLSGAPVYVSADVPAMMTVDLNGLGISYCCLGDASCEYDPSIEVPQPVITSCGTTPAFPCTATAPACQEKYDDLLELVDDFNDFADGEGVTSTIDGAWIESNPCYFVNEYLCPCLDGYMAKLQAVMADEEFSTTEQEDPTLWCILDYCTLPELACDPLPVLTGSFSLEVPPEDPCDSAITVNATMNAQLTYQQHRERYQHDFLQDYKNVCKQGLETLSRSYEGKSAYHFTLYYYDQAGNLVRTVPPAGVVAVDPTDQRIADDRHSGSRTIFTTHGLTSDHVYNSLGQSIYERVPDKDAMALWDGHVPTGLPDGLRITGSSFQGARGYLTGYTKTSISVPTSPTGSASQTWRRGYLFSTSDGGTSWSRMPNVLASDLKGIHFISGTRGYAVGSGGAMLRTNDGGQTWDQVGTKVTMLNGLDFNDVAFFDGQNGVVVGNNGFMRRTTSFLDGFPNGAYYTKPSGVHDILAVSALSSTSYGAGLEEVLDGFGVPQNGENGLFIAGSATGDGLTVQTNGLRTTADLNAVSVLTDQTHAFVAGSYGVLLRTDAAGSTSSSPLPIWRTVPTHITDDFIDIWFLDETTGVAIMDSTVNTTHTGVLRYTIDHGHTWSAAGRPEFDLKDLRASVNTSDEVLAVGSHGQVVRLFISAGEAPTIAVVSGLPNTTDLTAGWTGVQDGHTIVLAGDDEGKLWWTLDCTEEHPVWSNEAAFASSELVRTVEATVISTTVTNIALLSGTSAFSAGNRWIGSLMNAPTPDLAGTASTGNEYEALGRRPDGDVVFFQTTNNKQEKWTLSAGSPIGVQLNNSGPTTTSVRALGPVDDAKALVIGASGTLWLGHQTSSTVSTWYDRSRTLRPLPVYGFNKGGASFDAAGAQGTLYRRESGYWSAIPTRSTTDLHGISVVSLGETYAVGDDGLVLKGNLVTGSSSFTEVPLTVTYDLNDIQRTGDEVTIAGDAGHVLYKANITTTDPFQESSFSCGNINRLSRAPSGDVFAVVDGSALYRIHGAAGIPVSEVFTPQLNDVSFATLMNGYVVGINGLVRHTTDGGTTWHHISFAEAATPPPVPPSAFVPFSFNAVDCYAPDMAMAVGNSRLMRSLGSEKHTAFGFVGTTGNPATTTTWTDVAVGASGEMFVTGFGNSSTGNYALYRPQAATWSWGSISGSVSLKTVWKWPRYNGKDDFLTGSSNGRLSIFRYNPGTDAFMTSPTRVDLSTMTTAGINAIWFHDRREGLIATTAGNIHRIRFNDADRTWSTGDFTYQGPTITSLGASHPDGLDGQSDLAKIAVTTIGFSDRNQGFLGGGYDTTTTATSPPKRYARTIFDEIDRYTGRFWYDRLGRLVLSQSSQQFDPDNNAATSYPKLYSYSFYDNLGRVVESGQVSDPGPSVPYNSTATAPPIANAFGAELNGRNSASIIDAATLRAWIEARSNASRTEVTRTTYDVKLSTGAEAVFPGGHQENLHQRVAAMAYYKTLDQTTYDHATHFSYDIHGNAKSVVQEYPYLGDETDPDQQYKRIDYAYDLVSGNVKQVDYQKGQRDQFHHRYTYDADNRIVKVETSVDDIAYHEDAAYFYYPHGPLLRTELGELKVQGMDYAYTLQGWIKGVNSELLTPHSDMGQDGVTSTANEDVGRDAFGYSLTYFDGDYEPIDGDQWGDNTTHPDRPFAPKSWTNLNGYNNLYNGNIAATVHTLQPWGGWANTLTGSEALAGVYHYDQLNRLREYKTYSGLTTSGTNTWGTVDGKYFSSYHYDANGNIVDATRNYNNVSPYDQLTYSYHKDANGRLASNRLYELKDLGSNALVTTADGVEDLPYANPTFVDGGTVNTANNYRYDHSGNLVHDQREEIETITWTAAGKVLQVDRTSGSTRNQLRFGYGVDGHRITKTAYNGAGTTFQFKEWYVYDPQGNIMATYRHTTAGFHLQEHPIYGRSRLGNLDLSSNTEGELMATENDVPPDISDLKPFLNYELTDHQGNVEAVVSGSLLLGTGAPHEAEVVGSKGYEPFGSLLPGRTHHSDSYRFGFQGQEKDDEMHGGIESSSYAFEYRIYDSRIGRFLGIDPLSNKYAWNSPYSFSENKVIQYVELEGLETDELPVNQESESGNNSAGAKTERNALMEGVQIENLKLEITKTVLQGVYPGRKDFTATEIATVQKNVSYTATVEEQTIMVPDPKGSMRMVEQKIQVMKISDFRINEKPLICLEQITLNAGGRPGGVETSLYHTPGEKEPSWYQPVRDVIKDKTQEQARDYLIEKSVDYLGERYGWGLLGTSMLKVGISNVLLDPVVIGKGQGFDPVTFLSSSSSEKTLKDVIEAHPNWLGSSLNPFKN